MITPSRNNSIIQVIFTFNNALTYTIDVNGSITFHDLKNMISSAAEIPKNTFKMMNQNHDYTDMNTELLQNCFPNEQNIHFQVIITQVMQSSNESMIKLRLAEYCFSHSNKYLLYYCYSCNKSICSVCFQSIEHNSHQIIEKSDYLQSSKHLVEAIFKDLFSQTDTSQISNISKAELLQRKLNKIDFPNLHLLLNNIEMNCDEIITSFKENSKTLISDINHHKQLIKKNCCSNLDFLKKEIGIEKIIADEKVFLTFDKKVKELSIFKKEILSSYEMFRSFNNQYESIDQLCEKIHSNILNILNNQLKAKEILQMKDINNKESLINMTNNEISQKKNRQTNFKKYILTPIYNTQELLISSTNFEIKKITVNFPIISGIACFFNNLAFCNLNNTLYLSGGLLSNNKPCQIFYKYEFGSKSITFFRNMKFPRYNHTLIAKDGFIYAVGGFETNTSEIFSLSTNKWERIDEMIKERQRPMLAFYNTFLYCFGGYSSKGYEISIEKINIHNQMSKWEIVPYVNSTEYEFKLCCSGLILSNNELYFIGGINDNGILNTVHWYDFDNNTFFKNDKGIQEKVSFIENTLFLMEDDYYCNIEETNYKFISVKSSQINNY